MNQPWNCPNCGMENHPNSTACYECRAPRPSYEQTPANIQPGNQQYAPHPGYLPPPPRRSNPIVPILITCAVLIVIVLVGGTCVAIALPNFIKIKDKAKEAEVKQNLHGIQLSVERFAVDHDGFYPPYLIGGEAQCCEKVTASAGMSEAEAKNAFEIRSSCNSIGVADPLLREGYLEAYPVNPFTRNGAAIHLLQEHLSSTPGGEDPLRNGTVTGLDYGTRFGPHCTQMGSVLADVRHPRFIVPSDEQSFLGHITAADTQYDCWDVWEGEKPHPYLPGMFFYKSMGSLVFFEDGSDEVDFTTTFLPQDADQYMLGAYAGMRTKGIDILGPEQPFADENGNQQWNYLRSEASTSPDHVQGCPYKVVDSSEDVDIQYGNPNGIRDAILLVLTAGEDYHTVN